VIGENAPVPVEPAFPEFRAELLPAWRLPADAGTEIVRSDRGTNNQTFLVAQGCRRFVLRISENLSVAQVHAEQRLLRWLRRADLPFEVPEPVATTGGLTVIETAAGPATLCRWLPGVRPDLAGEELVSLVSSGSQPSRTRSRNPHRRLALPGRLLLPPSEQKNQGQPE
jgi:Ser/Thr protein kinase RdoA (MazF antagonist)